MKTVSLDEALDTVMKLSPEEQEMLLEIVRNRRIAQRRQEMADSAKASLAEHASGLYPAKTAVEILRELKEPITR